MNLAILIPVYNAERYLGACLDAVLASAARLVRERPGWRVGVFCRDDGSRDGSAEILARYAAVARAGIEFAYAKQKNAGVSVTRNRLLDELPAAYDVFAFCDSDDYVLEEMYPKLAEALERTGSDVAECGWKSEGEETAVADAETVVDDMSVYWLKRTSPGAWINVVNKLYRRSAVGAVRFRKGLSFEEDLFFNCEVNAQAKRKVIVPGDFYIYRDNPDSATHALDHRRYFASVTLRVRLSHEVFLKPGRVPKPLVADYRAELAKDAFRMMLRKNLKKNPDGAEREALFQEAGRAFAALECAFGFAPVGLNPVQRLLYAACRRGRYALARLLVYLT